MNTNSYYLFKFVSHGDDRGMMCVGEFQKEIPFIIKRVFYDFNNSSSDSCHRGNHANINSRFVFVCLCGSCTIRVDDGFSQSEFDLNDPSTALFVDKMVWKEMFNFSDDSILLVLSDCVYDPREYINVYTDFIKIKKGNNEI